MHLCLSVTHPLTHSLTHSLTKSLVCAGAVAARLRVYDSGICFVCSHLSSGENEGDELKRNYDYSEIVRRGQFPPDSAVLDPETVLTGSPSAESITQVRLAISLLG